MSEPIRVLLADDDVIVREGLAGLLDRQDGIDVVAVAENGSMALRELSRRAVDVALLDPRRASGRQGDGEAVSVGRGGDAHRVRA